MATADHLDRPHKNSDTITINCRTHLIIMSSGAATGPSPSRHPSGSSHFQSRKRYPKKSTVINQDRDITDYHTRLTKQTAQTAVHLRQRNAAHAKCVKYKKNLTIMCSRQRVLLHSLEAYKFLQNSTAPKPHYLPNSYTNTFHHRQEENNELMAAILSTPCTTDTTFVTQLLASINLQLTGNSSYVQSAMHPAVPIQNLFSSNKINTAINTLLGGKNKPLATNMTSLKILIASSATVTVQLLRACGLVQAQPVKLPLCVLPELWTPDSLSTHIPDSDSDNLSLATSENTETIKKYLAGALRCVSGKKILPKSFTIPLRSNRGSKASSQSGSSSSGHSRSAIQPSTSQFTGQQ